MKNDKKQEDPLGQPWTSSGLLAVLTHPWPPLQGYFLHLPYKRQREVNNSTQCVLHITVCNTIQCNIPTVYQQVNSANKSDKSNLILRSYCESEEVIFFKTTILQHNLKHSSKSENTWVLEITIWTLSSKTKPLPLHWFKHLSYFIDLFWLTGHYLNKNIRT
jgi:hypothetical protein